MLAQRSAGKVVSISLSTGGVGYTSRPTVTISGGGGTGASAVAHMAGTQVESIAIVNAGSGYTSSPTVTITGAGTGAVASAYAYTGPIRPASFVRSRFNDMYVFDGMGRGLRWNGTSTTMQPVGLQKPAVAPTIVTGSSAMSGYVSEVGIVSGGTGYSSPPAVTFTGGTPTTPASGRAILSNGRVSEVMLTERGSGYQTAPSVSFSGGNPSTPTLNTGVVGSVASLTITNRGSGYTSAPTVVFSDKQGLTNALATVTVSNGSIDTVSLFSGGTGATTAVTASLSGGGGAGGVIQVGMQYSVASVTVSNGGAKQFTAPTISFRAATSDIAAIPAAATATVNSSGVVTAVTVSSGGSYSEPPQAYVADQTAIAAASITNVLQGKYKCAIRYLDNTALVDRGPVCSSISDLAEVDIPNGAQSLTWSFSHVGLDDRVYGMELWRSTADQSVLLYRVATIYRADAGWTGSYTDTLSDEDLIDTERLNYGLLPVTLPSGQANARRFGVPPGNYAVACMFQDRCWFAVDTSGKAPNSLLFSEIDEPESVPADNEIVVQESAADSDAVVALIPLGASLLILQSRHIYRLQYVAQPVIDASIMLVGYRGALNSRCWDVLGGVAYIVDSNGMYAFDGQREDPLSVPVDTFWRDGSIDFAYADKFHVKADNATKIIRFFYCATGTTEPAAALAYSLITKTWWTEEYPTAMTAASPTVISGQQSVVYGTSAGGFKRHSGYSDDGTAISYTIRMPPMRLVNEGGDRSITIVHTPTETDTDTRLRLRFNGSANARPSAIVSDRGQAGVSIQGEGVSINLKRTLSALGESSGVVRVYYTGRVDDRSAGADRHVSVSFGGTQASSSDALVIHSVSVAGVS
jgi:hypothetical protein